MKKILVYLMAMIFLISVSQAVQYHQKVGPWSLEFDSSNNFSGSVAEGTGHRIMAFEDNYFSTY